MANADSKAPPPLKNDTIYENWRKDITIWSAFTSLKDEQKGPAVFFRIENQAAKDRIREIPVEQLQVYGVKKVIETLDKLYLKDENIQAYESYELFEKFQRPSGMNISDYIIKFESLYNKAKSHEMIIHDGVLAYRLLKSANLKSEEIQLVKATVGDINYDNMKNKLKMVFTERKEVIPESFDNIKVEKQCEPSYYSDNTIANDNYQIENPTFYSHNNSFSRGGRSIPRGAQRGRGYFGNRGQSNSNNFANRGQSYSNNYSNRGQSNTNNFANRGQSNSYSSNRSQQNSFSNEGNTSKCHNCGSKFHWANKCPDRYTL